MYKFITDNRRFLVAVFSCLFFNAILHLRRADLVMYLETTINVRR